MDSVEIEISHCRRHRPPGDVQGSPFIYAVGKQAEQISNSLDFPADGHKDDAERDLALSDACFLPQRNADYEKQVSTREFKNQGRATFYGSCAHVG